MEQIEIDIQQTNSRTSPKEYKDQLVKLGLVHCGFCPFHRKENVKRNSRFTKKHGRNDRYKNRFLKVYYEL